MKRQTRKNRQQRKPKVKYFAYNPYTRRTEEVDLMLDELPSGTRIIPAYLGCNDKYYTVPGTEFKVR